MELDMKHLIATSGWIGILLLFCSGCVNPSLPKDFKDFPGTSLAFETSKTDRTIFKNVDWSMSENLVLQGWDIPASKYPLYLASLKRTGIVTPLFVDYELVYGTNPSLSPKGQRLAFWDSGQEQIRVLNLDNTPETIAFLPKELNGQFDWSFDGQEIALINLKVDHSLVMYIFDLTGDLQKTLEFFDPRFFSYDFDESMSWSPDGKQMAFSLSQKREEDNNLQGDVFVIDIDNGFITQLTNTPNWNDTSVSWSPDNEQVIFVSTPVDTIPEVGGQLTIADVDGSCIEMARDIQGVTSVSWGVDPSSVAVTAEGKVYIVSLGVVDRCP